MIEKNPKIYIPNRELELLSSDDKQKYFLNLKSFCMDHSRIKVKKDNHFHKVITKLYPKIPKMRNYDYEIIGKENIPNDGNGIFLCNHSNSHDFFTAHEVFESIGTNVSVFSASDDLPPILQFLFHSCGAVLIDRENPQSIKRGITDFSFLVMNGMPGVIFGEATWNLHPYKIMHQIKIGGVLIGAITEKPVIPTIFEYVESKEICLKESDLYLKCIVKFGKPIFISRGDSLITQTNYIQSVLEKNRLELWEQLNIDKRLFNQDIYLNHTYLKKFGAMGYTYDSEKESKYLFSKDNCGVENEYHLDRNGNFVPGITKKKSLWKR